MANTVFSTPGRTLECHGFQSEMPPSYPIRPSETGQAASSLLDCVEGGVNFCFRF